MLSRFRIVPAALLVALSAVGSGCVALVAGAAAGAGTYAYVTGELKATVDGTLEETYQASRKAIQTLKFTPTEFKSDALQARVGAKMADDRAVSIELAKATDATTEVRIRVGAFGDEKVSTEILAKIRENL